MKNLNLLSLIALACIISLGACKNEKSGTEATEATDAAGTIPAVVDVSNPAGTTGEGTPVAPTGPTTTVEYETMVHDYGEIMEGEKVKYEFKFKNTGSEPLVISDAKGSCGCTVPDWPREPIAPGASGVVKVEFDSKGKGNDDGSKQTKRVTVTANTNPAQTYLTISGVVKKDPKAPKTEEVKK
ncbi:MAG: DUF1573 domain-containing protein [Bacteroidota bacterium]|nr:DUF1573 domain-containing protein [Bacteroidota bacterium]